MRETICGHSRRGCHSCGSRNPVLIHRPFRINPPRTGCSALSTSTSMAFSISLSLPSQGQVLFFSLKCRFPRFMDFIPNQTVNFIFPSETVHQIVLMLVYTLHKVRGDACIQGAIPFAAKNVNEELLQKLSLDSRSPPSRGRACPCESRGGNDMITSL
jgi:hypothetical protein